ncbi:uncharacterized protein LOC105781405 [Gossypium raimondii]|uniref:uncharacterized protein LOC105781405 n=1 Tax=Gossypium raimondii TaxID=29730 RepID=UPI00063A91C4|nr:uncharacterized protein LOC105781405 [Gossypium raimondii]
MHEFCSMLEYCELSDLGFIGRWFTWEKGRLASSNIRKRLDKGVVNMEWWSLFLDYVVKYLHHSISDNCPLLIDTMGVARRRLRTGSYKFRFEANRCLEESCEEEIWHRWVLSSNDVLIKLEKLGGHLQRWSHHIKKDRVVGKRNLEERLLERYDQ